MARYLPKKKYLSRLFNDTPGPGGDLCSRDSQLSLLDDSSQLGSHFADAMLTATALSNQSEDGSEAVGGVDFQLSNDCSSSNSLRLSAGELKGIGCLGSHDSLYRDDCDALLRECTDLASADQDPTDADDGTYSPVYFDREPFDDMEHTEPGKETSKVELNESVHVATSGATTLTDTNVQTSVLAAHTMDGDVTVKKLEVINKHRPDVCVGKDIPSVPLEMPVTSIPSQSSFASLCDAEVLGGLLTSAESLASFLGQLNTPTTESSRLRSLLSGKSEVDLSINIDEQLHDNLTATYPAAKELSEEGFHSTNPGSGSGQSGSQDPLEILPSLSDGLASSDGMAEVKEEQLDIGYEKKDAVPAVTTSGRNRGRGKANEPKFECQVCGDVAAGYHCGAYVCEACKKFYLRCLKMGDSPAFLCPKSNNCEISKDTRSHCQFCRFKKCIRLGMYRPGCEDDRKLKVDFRSISCKVCNAPSSGFHFGAITCEGCKGFFRRMLKEQLHKKFVCTNGEACEIDSANRTNCKFCRFAKCLRVGMTLEGTRLGRQSNSVKLSTLMQYQTDALRGHQSESSTDDFDVSAVATSSDMHHATSANQDEVDECYSDSDPLDGNLMPMRSFSDAASHVAVRRGSRRRRSDTDTPPFSNGITETVMALNRNVPLEPSSVSDGPVQFSERRPHFPEMPFNIEDRAAIQDHFHVANMSTFQNPRFPSEDQGTEHHSVRILEDENNVKRKVPVHSADQYSGKIWSEGVEGSSFRQTSTDHTVQSAQVVGSPVCVPFDAGSGPGAFQSPHTLNERTDRLSRLSGPFQNVPQLSDCESLELQRRRFAKQTICSPSELTMSASETHNLPLTSPPAKNYHLVTEKPPCFNQTQAIQSPPPVAVSVDAEWDLDRLIFDDPVSLFSFLGDTFRELDEIMNRPAELEALKNSPASMETLWKLVEIPFMHQARIILRFIKKIPGFRRLPVEDQIKMAQDSVYPITLIYHSKYYNLETGAYNWFINTPQERDLVLGILPPFAALGSHFSSTGYTLKRLFLSDVEMAFLAVMAVLTAAEESRMQSAKQVTCLQNFFLEAFICFCQGSNDTCRLSLILARLCELRRANIEHCLIAAQIQQMTPQMEMSTLWREMFLTSGVTS